MTVADALARATRTLAAAGVSDPDWNAELLLRHVTGRDRTRLVLDASAPLGAAHGAALDQLVAQRACRIPLQHLTGVQAFWRHDFHVTPDVLIPRFDTELLVEAALARMPPRAVVVDVGTGSGCIAVSLKAERPDADVHAVDLSPAALAVARDNARRIGVDVTFHEGDLLTPLAAIRLDMVVSNPPYIEAADVDGLEPEVRDHDPRLALVPAEGPLKLYERLIGQAAAMLLPGGWLLLEVGSGQADTVITLAFAAGLREAASVPDLAGIPRVVAARKP